MRKRPADLQTLAEPQRALRVYLDALLSEATFAAQEEDAAEQQQYLTATNPVSSVTPETPAAAPSKLVATAVSTTDAVAPIQAQINPPDWAQGQFQCLSFQVAGVTLAAPLEKLNGIVELVEEITELPGYAPWVIGLLPNRGRNVQVVDVAQIIMPNEGDAVSQPAAQRMKYIILLNDGQFGLAVDSISQVLSLEADEVRWRGEKSKRPWLAGTVIEQMCALLEIDLLCTQLKAGMKGGE